MKKWRWIGMVILTGALLTAGCMGPPKHKKSLGSPTRKTMAQQIADPKAGDRIDTGEGLEGRAAEGLMDRYDMSFGAKSRKSNP